MSKIMQNVDQRTQLVGENRLELLLFRLAGRQVYGINVFKVREVLQCPSLNEVPQRHASVRGVAHIRGTTLPIMDLGQAMGQQPLNHYEGFFVIITEYNRTIQGFLVSAVERIVNLNWRDVNPPPRGMGTSNYLTAVTRVDEKLVEIIDVEKVLSEIMPITTEISADVSTEGIAEKSAGKHVLIVDDSGIARKQVNRVVEALGVRTVVRKDGQEALDYLREMVDQGLSPVDELMMVISDIEMPVVDGYTFTTEVRNDPQLKGLFIILHTSLSGVFNENMVKKVGADRFLAKFNPDELAQVVSDRIMAAESE